MNDLQVIEHQNKRVLTTAQLAEGYGTTPEIISNNFTRNRGRYEAGKHFFCLEGESLREFKTTHQFDDQFKHTPKIYLWTEHGTLIHAKSLGTDQAWAVYEKLVDTYFRVRDNAISVPKTLPEALRLAADLAEQNEALSLANIQKDQIIGELKPKADYVDFILSRSGTMAPAQIAADYSMSATKLNKILHNAGIQRRVGEQWILYAEHMGKGYTKSETIPITRSDGRPDTKMHTCWTQKGRLMINKVLNENGIYANMDIPARLLAAK